MRRRCYWRKTSTLHVRTEMWKKERQWRKSKGGTCIVCRISSGKLTSGTIRSISINEESQRFRLVQILAFDVGKQHDARRKVEMSEISKKWHMHPLATSVAKRTLS